MISFWEQQSFLQYDHIIIGSGITGLSTAISLKERYPNQSILVLERGIFPSGASTKNAGFACIGSLTEILADLKIMPVADVLGLIVNRRAGLALLRQRLGDTAIDYQELGSYELLAAPHMKALESLDKINDLLQPLLQQKAFSLHNDLLTKFRFHPPFAQALIVNHCEGQIDTGKMMRALLHLALAKGIIVINGASVAHFEEKSSTVNIQVKSSLSSPSPITFQAAQVYICTNAFAAQLLPEMDVQPGRGQVIVTHPIPNLPFKGIFHYDEGYFYFRNFENRVIFGGGRNVDFAGETSTELKTTTKIIATLKVHLEKYILPDTPFEIAHQWAGIMGFNENKRPIVRRLSDRVLIGAKMGGMGVAIGSLIGAKLAALA